MNDPTNWNAVAWLGFACSSVFFLAIGAICLTTACKLSGVKPPDFFPAMVFNVLISLAVMAVWFVLAIVMGLVGGSDITSHTVFLEMLGRTGLIALVMYPFLAAAIYTVVLQECGILRGLLIWFMQFVVLAGLGLLIYGCFFVAEKAFGA